MPGPRLSSVITCGALDNVSKINEPGNTTRHDLSKKDAKQKVDVKEKINAITRKASLKTFGLSSKRHLLKQPKSTHGKESSTSSSCEAMELDEQLMEDSDVAMHEVSFDVSVFTPKTENKNIDRKSVCDPVMVTNYAHYVFGYLKQLEVSLGIRKEFLLGTSLTAKMRSVLINWLQQLHFQFKLLDETMYLAVWIMDSYVSLHGHTVHRYKYQLVAVAAMLIACKYEETSAPIVDDFVYMTDSTYKREEIISMEMNVLLAVDFQLSWPSSIQFLSRYIIVGGINDTQHLLAKYIVEACLVGYAFAHIPPSKLAAAALLFSIKLVEHQEFHISWKTDLEYHSGYNVNDLLPIIYIMATVLQEIATSKFDAAFKKYCLPINQNLAVCISSTAANITIIKRLAENSSQSGERQFKRRSITQSTK